MSCSSSEMSPSFTESSRGNSSRHDVKKSNTTAKATSTHFDATKPQQTEKDNKLRFQYLSR